MAGFDRLTPEGEKFYKELAELEKLEVRIGFQEEDGAYENEATIAEIAAYNEFGTEDIPSRPFLRNTADNNRDKLSAFGGAQARKLAQGSSAKDCLQAIGAFAKGLVQEEIIKGEFAENAESTIKKKGSDKPLIGMTGRLRQSVSSVIKPKGSG